MKSAKVVFGLLAALWGTACDKSSSNSIVVVTVTPAPSAPAVTRLRVVLTNRSSSDTVLFPQTNSGAPIKFNASFAVTFPKSRSGELDIATEALDALSNVVASGSGRVVIVVGGRADVTIPLADGGSADGGIPDSGLGEAGPGAAETAAADTRTFQDAGVPDVVVSRDGKGSGGEWRQWRCEFDERAWRWRRKHDGNGWPDKRYRWQQRYRRKHGPGHGGNRRHDHLDHGRGQRR